MSLLNGGNRVCTGVLLAGFCTLCLRPLSTEEGAHISVLLLLLPVLIYTRSSIQHVELDHLIKLISCKSHAVFRVQGLYTYGHEVVVSMTELVHTVSDQRMYVYTLDATSPTITMANMY